ncbi:sperm motility kinase-like [Ictidomys tridecemlineatus]
MRDQCSQSRVELQEQSSCSEPAFTDHYMVLKDIGEGGFAQLKLARHLLTGTQVAVKVLAKGATKFTLLSEPEMMAELDHPNVIHLFQVMETKKYLYLIMEHAGGGELWDFIPTTGMDEEEARRMFRQIGQAVQYCHQKGIVHLDLKPENVVVDEERNVKLIDFGLSTRVTAGKKLNKFFGTLLYVPPEIICHQEYEGPPADIWSLGVVLYSMLTGIWPFEASTDSKLKKLIRLGRYIIPSHVSKEAKSLIREILKVDPKQRPTIDQVMGHPWLTQGEEAPPSSPGEVLPKLPDLTILKTMINMGYDHYNTWVSVVRRKFNDAMATYRILQHQSTQGEASTAQVKPKHYPGPKDPPWVCHKKFPSEPALPLPCEQQQQPARRASMPTITLRCFLKDTLPPSPASQPDPVPSPSPSQETSRRQAPDRIPGWKRVRRRIAKCLRQLCCIPCFRGPLSRKRVVPVETPSPDRQN